MTLKPAPRIDQRRPFFAQLGQRIAALQAWGGFIRLDAAPRHPPAFLVETETERHNQPNGYGGYGGQPASQHRLHYGAALVELEDRNAAPDRVQEGG